MPHIPKIEIKDLHKSFGSKKVLQGVNLKVMPGESVFVLGGSGTGKSVLLKCILGLVKPDRGSIKIDGVEVLGLSPSEQEYIHHKIGMLFQGGALFDSLKVWENVAFQLMHVLKISPEKAREIAEEKLQEVGLSKDVMQLWPAELSGGMQKRVGLARAIAAHPSILFFDEPTTGLDPIMCGVIDNLIKKSVRNLGATAITITHDLISMHAVADKVAMIHEGKIIWHGPVKSIDSCTVPAVQDFLNGRNPHYVPKTK